MLMKNPTTNVIRIPDLKLTFQPGGVAEVPDGYCVARKAPNGAVMASIVAMLAPQLVPADDSLVEKWKARTLDLEAPKPAAPTAADFQAQGMPPAVAALVADGNADSVKPKRSIPVTKGNE